MTSLKRLKTETKILNCEAKAVIDNNFKFWNEERSSLFRFRNRDFFSPFSAQVACQILAFFVIVSE